MINKWIGVGRLGQDPEMRTTGGGMAVCTLRVATDYRKKNQAGEWENQTEWVSVILFGRQAENAGQYLKKGRQVYVEGRLQTRKWQDKEGRDRWTTEVVANELKFLGGKEGGSGGGGRGGYGKSNTGGGGGSYGGGGNYANDGDIPF